MKGIERKIDQLGRIVIPMEFRKELGISVNSKVEISLSKGEIIIRSTNGRCALCGETVLSDAKIQLCNSCIAMVKEV